MLYTSVFLRTEEVVGSKWMSWPWTEKVTVHSLRQEKSSLLLGSLLDRKVSLDNLEFLSETRDSATVDSEGRDGIVRFMTAMYLFETMVSRRK